MSLPIFVTQDKWQDFDDAWNELMAADGPIDELLVALKLAGEKKRIARCVPLVRQHAELLEIAGRHADAAHVLGAAVSAGAPTAELGEALMRNATAAWGEEAWWPSAVELTGLGDASSLRKAWTQFIKLQRFQPGAIIFHPSGWGTGEITKLADNDTVVHVRFQSGRKDFFPMGAALDIFEPLEAEDLRTRYFADPDGLVKQIKKDPLDALRAVLGRYHGRAGSAAIKNALAQVGVEGSSFSAWWRKAKRLAENSEWFRVSGSGKKVEVHLLLTAADPEEQLSRQLSHAAGLQEVIAKARDLFAGKDVADELCELVYAELERGAADESEDYGQRLGAWMLLRERRGETPEAFRALLDEAKAAEAPSDDPQHVPALWAIFQALPTTHDQELATELLVELYGEDWLEQAVAHLDQAAPGMVRGLVERMLTAKKQKELFEHYCFLLTRPTRAPHVMIALAKLAESGKLEGELPSPLDRARAFASLATHLYSVRRASTADGRAHTKAVELLAGGKSPLFERLLADAKRSEIHSVQILTQRGVEESIENLLLSIAMQAEDDTIAEGEVHFWMNDSIWTTRSGLDKLGRELKELKEVKMPENEEAIGRAASLGDLSENSEWEAALEEKRNLSARVGIMEADLAKAQLLENAILPENTVSPGTLVRYREGKDETLHVIRLLGPWDGDKGDDVVSYRAPLAQGILGLHKGDIATVQLPGGAVHIEVIEIQPISVD
jgi:transcription elongation factor GreA